MLNYLITSKAKRSLLKLFLTNPERSFYVREVSKLTEEPLTAVRRELGRLEKAGLVKSRREGKVIHYSVVKGFPYYSELKKIVYGTVALGDYLRDVFRRPGEIELALVYGSVARNEETSKSDIDLFVVGSVGETELHSLVSQIERDIGRTINYTVMSKQELEERLKREDPFIKRVMSEKAIVLKGSRKVD